MNVKFSEWKSITELPTKDGEYVVCVFGAVTNVIPPRRCPTLSRTAGIRVNIVTKGQLIMRNVWQKDTS